MARLTQEEMIEVDLAIVPMVEWSGAASNLYLVSGS